MKRVKRRKTYRIGCIVRLFHWLDNAINTSHLFINVIGHVFFFPFEWATNTYETSFAFNSDILRFCSPFSFDFDLICFFLCRRNISCVGWKLVPTNWEIFFSISFHSLFFTFNVWFSKVDQLLSLLYPDTQVELVEFDGCM